VARCGVEPILVKLRALVVAPRGYPLAGMVAASNGKIEHLF